MYPQPHYQSQPFDSHQQEQQQQPYYSFFPPTSDSSLHPPGTNPIANSAPFSAYASQTEEYPNWVAQQPEPISYDLGNVSTAYPFDPSFRISYQNLFFLMLCHLGRFLILAVNR